MDDLDRFGIRAVPVLMWNPTQVPALAGETVRDLIADEHSRSWAFLSDYISEFIERYRSRRTILSYELSNELNSLADLDIRRRCDSQQRGKLCVAMDNFTTDEMIAFTRRFAALIRKLDPAHPISSGFTVPRRAAEHIRRGPERSGRIDWTSDSIGELEKNIRDIHQHLDIVNIHVYPAEEYRQVGGYGGSRVDTVATLKGIADKLGKPLFVGEFGEGNMANKSQFISTMIDRIVNLNVPYSGMGVGVLPAENLRRGIPAQGFQYRTGFH